jgi:hypothetical protein
MKLLLGAFFILASAQLSAAVLTFDCIPNELKKEGGPFRFVIDTENKTWEWKEEGHDLVSILDDVAISGNAVSVKGVHKTRGYAMESAFSISRIDLTYLHSQWLGDTSVGSYTGQCKIVEDQVERAF